MDIERRPCDFQFKQIAYILKQVVDKKEIDRVLAYTCIAIDYSLLQVPNKIIINQKQWEDLSKLVNKYVEPKFITEVIGHFADILEYSVSA